MALIDWRCSCMQKNTDTLAEVMSAVEEHILEQAEVMFEKRALAVALPVVVLNRYF